MEQEIIQKQGDCIREFPCVLAHQDTTSLKTSPDSLRELWEMLRSCRVVPSSLRASSPFWGYR